MRSLKRSGVTALTAALALALGAIPLAVMAPSLLGGSPPLTISPALAPADTLTLATTSSQGTVSWNGRSETFTGGQQCKIAPGGSAGLLGITGSVGSAQGSAGFKEGNIGVFELTGNNQPPANAAQCFRVDAGSFTSTETLTLSLGAEVTDSFLVATSATVSLQTKSQDGTLVARMLGAGSPPQPDPAPQIKWTKQQPAPIPITLTLPTGNFDRISLEATAGSFSLVGATFNLVSKADAVLDCAHPSISKGSTTATYIGAAGQACAGSVGVVLTSDANSAELLKPIGQVPNAEFVFDVVWKNPANIAQPTQPLVPRTSADFDGSAGNPATPLSWCPNLIQKRVGATDYPVVNNVNGNPAPAGVVDQARNYPGTGVADTRQFACIVSQSPSLNSTNNELTVTEKIYVFGDIRLAR